MSLSDTKQFLKEWLFVDYVDNKEKYDFLSALRSNLHNQTREESNDLMAKAAQSKDYVSSKESFDFFLSNFYKKEDEGKMDMRSAAGNVEGWEFLVGVGMVYSMPLG